MKKFAIAMVAVLLSSTLASACIGGNLIQVLDTDESGNQLVVANYDIATGKMVARARSYQVTSVKLNRSKDSNLCANADCSQLSAFDNISIKVSYETKYGVEDSVVIRNASVGANTPTAKGIRPRATITNIDTDITQDNIEMHGCSKK